MSGHRGKCSAIPSLQPCASTTTCRIVAYSTTCHIRADIDRSLTETTSYSDFTLLSNKHELSVQVLSLAWKHSPNDVMSSRSGHLLRLKDTAYHASGKSTCPSNMSLSLHGSLGAAVYHSASPRSRLSLIVVVSTTLTSVLRDDNLKVRVYDPWWRTKALLHHELFVLTLQVVRLITN